MNMFLAEPECAAANSRQRATWASGDHAKIVATLQLVGERLIEALDLKTGERVLGVAAGNVLLGCRRERVLAERFAITFEDADAEDLPFDDGEFDVALSTFGIMFTPAQERAAAELSRVVRHGGRIGLASCTPGVEPPAPRDAETRFAKLFPGHAIQMARLRVDLRGKDTPIIPSKYLEVVVTKL